MKKNIKLLLTIGFVLFFSTILGGCPVEPASEPKETCTVTFDAKNGTEPVKVVVEKGKTVSEPKTPIREGWTFKCWEDKIGYDFDFDTKITSDITLYAEWWGVANFYDGKGEIIYTKTYGEGWSIYSISCEDYETDDKNYTFLYWSTNIDATDETREKDEFDFETDITVSPLNLYAIYTEENVYTVTIDYNILDRENEEVRVIEGLPTKSPFVYSSPYFDFEYWYVEDEENPDDYKTSFDFNTPITGNITLKAKWALAVDDYNYLYNGVYKVYNSEASEATKEELDGIKLTYSIGSKDNSQNDLPIKEIEVKDYWLYCYFDFINPEEQATYYVTITNGILTNYDDATFYPFGPVSNLTAVPDDTSVTLKFDGKSGYSYYTIKYYPTDKPEEIKELTDKNSSCIISGLTNNTEYTFEVYTQSNENEEGMPVELSEKVEITAIPKVTKKQSDYLMIMYMDGDNDLNNPIFFDMNEVEYGLYQIRNSSDEPKTGYADVNVVALWDGWAESYGYDEEGNAIQKIGKSGSYIYELGRDYGNTTTYTNSDGCVLSTNTKDLTSKASWIENNEVDMGDKQTLINFLNWVNERYEADKVILQFSNHGGGPRSAPIYAKTEDGFSIKIDNSGRRALCWDESSSLTGGSFLKTSDVSDALAAAGYVEDNKLDMILMDVCLGASVEDSYQFKDYANYLVASPNTVPGMGMDYVSMMKSFTSDSTIESIGEQLIEDYRAYYTWPVDEWSQIIYDLCDYYTQLNFESYVLNYIEENNITEETITEAFLQERYTELFNLLYEGDFELLVQKASFMSQYGISTLSMIDLTKIDELEDKITALAELLLDNKDKVFNGVPAQDGSSVSYIQFLRDYYVRYSGAEALSLAYQGTYSWLFDIGYMVDRFSFVAADTINGEQNLDAWPELVTACSDVKTALEGAIVKAWRDSPYVDNSKNPVSLYEVLGGSGLVISGETIAVDGGNIVPGSCPDFYETDLAFGKDSAWTELLVEWFGN
ncbi:MAG: InlB B-repeat-containing protein [Spirochaetaceae bacterium]|nr:InlB B-repeat-containing protein [Spirochaetaceae bacterium]